MPVLSTVRLAHRERVGVVGPGGVQPDEPFRGVELLDLGVGGGRVELVRDLVEGDERGPGIFPVDVDLPRLLGLPKRRGPEPSPLVDREALCFQKLGRHLRDDLLLGEPLAADHDGLGGGGASGQGRGCEPGHEVEY
jgi:hypothetical protein